MSTKTPIQQFPTPKALSPGSAQLWIDVVPRQARSAERLALVEQALRALDRAEACREQIEISGMLIASEGKMLHVNPLLKVEKDARGQFASLWKALRLNYCGSIDGRHNA